MISVVSLVLIFFSCKQNHAAKEPQIVSTPEMMNDEVSENLKAVLAFANDNGGKINDSIKLYTLQVLDSYYTGTNFKAVWSNSENWLPYADSLYYFLNNSLWFGLYPTDYHLREIKEIRQKILTDSLSRKNATIWTKADLLLTDAFMRVLKDMYEGRLVDDSISVIHKQSFIDTFFITALKSVIDSNNITSTILNVEPGINDYHELRKEVKGFTQNMDTTQFLHINYPYKDTIGFYRSVHIRLLQEGIGDSGIRLVDSILIRKEIKKYQENKGLKIDGKAGPEVINRLNLSDYEKFKRIALTLDRYKLLQRLPSTFIWVNIPAFKLKVLRNDTVILESKVIVGKPETRTPVLKSAITDMVTYPQWTIPESIIKKDILPALKIDPGYLSRKGFSLVSYDGQVIDPYQVDWEKYKTGIPWKVVQGSGDDNALGIFKFNFNNPYSVYLHDTNQRYLFGNTYRALSHGCVRVQKWKDLALIITNLDSIYLEKKGRHQSYNADSINTWLQNNDRKRIMVYNRVPVYIQYFSCEAKDGKILFYNDIYGNDQYLSQKYFKRKHF